MAHPQSRKCHIFARTFLDILRYVVLHGLHERFGEHHRAVPVRLEVNSDVEFLGLVVQVFHSRLGEIDRHAQRADELSGGAVGIGRLHDRAGESIVIGGVFEQARGEKLLVDQKGHQGGDLVAVEENPFGLTCSSKKKK